MQNKKPKILFIHHGGIQGGGFLSLLYIIKTLKQNKYNIKVLLLYHSTDHNILNDLGIDVEVVNDKLYKINRSYFIHSAVGIVKWYKIFSHFKTLLFWIKSAFFHAPEILKIESPDLVFVNSSVITDWAFASKKLGIKNIIHIQEPIARGYLGIRRCIMQHIINYSSDHIVAISQDNAARLNLKEKTTVIYNMIDETVFYNDNTDKGSTQINKTVLYAGGTDTHKGFYTMMKAIDYIDKDIKVLIVGGIEFNKRTFWQPSYWTNISKNRLIEVAKKNKNITFIGYTNELYKYLRVSSVAISPFAMPHFSRLNLEAFAMKKPVIASDVKGMSEVVDHGINGMLFKNRNAKSLAGAINYICNNPFIAKEMGERGYQKYKSKFSYNTDANFENIFDNLLNI